MRPHLFPAFIGGLFTEWENSRSWLPSSVHIVNPVTDHRRRRSLPAISRLSELGGSGEMSAFDLSHHADPPPEMPLYCLFFL